MSTSAPGTRPATLHRLKLRLSAPPTAGASRDVSSTAIMTMAGVTLRLPPPALASTRAGPGAAVSAAPPLSPGPRNLERHSVDK